MFVVLVFVPHLSFFCYLLSDQLDMLLIVLTGPLNTNTNLKREISKVRKKPTRVEWVWSWNILARYSLFFLFLGKMYVFNSLKGPQKLIIKYVFKAFMDSLNKLSVFQGPSSLNA